MKHIITIILTTLTTLGIVFGFGFGPRQNKIPDVVRSRAFHVVGRDGTVLVEIESGAGYGTIMTMNKNGKSGVVLGSDDAGNGVIITMNDKGKELVLLEATVDSGGAIRVMNGKGQELVRLGTNDDDGDGAIRIMNDKGKGLAVIRTNPDGTGGVVAVFDPNGKNDLGMLKTQTK